MTTFEPGARDVLTHSLLFRPFATAALASSPAATITVGLEVLVQEVIAAMTTSPCESLDSLSSATATGVPSFWPSLPGDGSWSPSPLVGGSDAGKDSFSASSWSS